MYAHRFADRSIAGIVVALGTVLVAFHSAMAGNNFFVPTSGGYWDWNDHWSTGYEPDWSESAYVVSGGTCLVRMNGETAGRLIIGHDSSVELQSGNLRIGDEFVGVDSYGHVDQYVGPHVTDTLTVGYFTDGDFWLNGGGFSSGHVILGDNQGSHGYFLQRNGDLDVGLMEIPINGGTGRYRIEGGTAAVNTLNLGHPAGGMGTLEIAGGATTLQCDYFTLRDGAVLSAVPGSTLSIGAKFDNLSTTPGALLALNNLEVVFPGRGELEIASQRDGGFTGNFALGALVVNGVVDLRDARDNNPDYYLDECLFTYGLDLTGGQLDLNHRLLYVYGDVEAQLNASIADRHLVSSGPGGIHAYYVPERNWTFVPEPSTLAVVIIGIVLALGRVWRR